MRKISVIAVVYNSAIESVPAVMVALSSDYVTQVVVCDNSTVETGNRDAAQKLGIDYISMGGNKGLSRAYNTGKRSCIGEVVCLFDDDTEVKNDYFASVYSLLESRQNWDVALPLVMCGKNVLSPCAFDGYRSRLFPSPEDIREQADLSGINSGMAIKRSLLNNIKHDERLFLDLVDHKFISDVKEYGGRIVYLKGPVLKQDYSLATDSEESAFSRLAIFERDARRFYSPAIDKRLYCSAMLLLRKVKLCARFRTLHFLKPASITRKDAR